MKRTAIAPLCLALLGLYACNAPDNQRVQVKPVDQNGKPLAVTTGKDDKGNAIKVTTVKGNVKVPKGFKVGEVAPTPGSTVSVADRPSYKLHQTATAKAEGEVKFTENPCEGLQVYLATRKGERFKGPTIGKVDAKGDFTISNVPLDLAFLVMTNTKDPNQRHAELCAPMQNISTAQNIQINYAGTLTTLSTVNSMQGNAMGTVNFNLFGQITTAVQSQLQTMNISALPNLNDPKAIEAFMGTIKVNGVPALQLVGDLRSTLMTNAIDASAAQAQLDNLLGQAGGLTFTGSGSITAPDLSGAVGAGTGIQIPGNLGGLFGGNGGTATAAPTEAPAEQPSAEPSAEASTAASAAPSAAPSATTASN